MPVAIVAPIFALICWMIIPMVAHAECEQSVTPAPREDPHFTEITQRKMEILQRLGTAQKLFIGDSLVQRWPADLLPAGTFNFGVGGDLTENVLWRLGHTKLPPAQQTVVLIGTNNLQRDSAPCVVAGIRAVIDAIRAQIPTTRIYLVGLLPRLRAPMPIKSKIEAVNREIAAGSTYSYIDLSAPVAGRPDLYLPDGVHLNPAGYAVVAPIFADGLKR